MTISTLYEPATFTNFANNSNLELGTKFSSSINGNITAIRFYKTATETGTHTGRIWSVAGSLLASVVFSGETAGGFQQQALASPLAITSGTNYYVSFNVNVNNLAQNVLTASQVNSSGQLTIPASGSYFQTGAGAFPGNGSSTTYYFGASLVFDDGAVLTAGTASLSSRSNTRTANVSTTAPSGGTSPYTYQWQISTDNTSFSNITGATSSTASYGASSDGVYYIRCNYADAASGSVTSNVIAITLATEFVFLGAIGDSITAGTALSGGTPPVTIESQALELINGYRMVSFSNRGIGGTQATDWVPSNSNYTNALTAFNTASTGISKKYVSIMLGTNDAYSTNNATKATYKAALLSTCNNLISNGYKVILNYSPFSSSGNVSTSLLQQYQTAINELINGTTILLGDNTVYQYFSSNTGQLQGDGIHPTQAGSDTLGKFLALAFWKAVYSTKPGFRRSLKL